MENINKEKSCCIYERYRLKERTWDGKQLPEFHELPEDEQKKWSEIDDKIKRIKFMVQIGQDSLREKELKENK